MNKAWLQLLLLLFISGSSSVYATENQNLWRTLFPDTPTITLSEIENRIEDIVLVDVRAKFLFDQGHKEGTRNVSFSSRMFMLKMEDLVEKNQGKTVVVYCDADNCIKSYRAVEKCQQAKMDNVVLFDLNKDVAQSRQDSTYTQLNTNQF